MYRRLLLIVVLGSLMAACVPYGDHGYYRNDVYTVDRYSYRDYDRPSYSYGRGYYVVPQQRYYAPAPRYYRAAPEAYYNNRYQGRGYDARYRHDEHGYRVVMTEVSGMMAGGTLVVVGTMVVARITAVVRIMAVARTVMAGQIATGTADIC